MDQVTRQNAASAEESAAASEEMNAQADQMKAMVGVLVALVEGDGSVTGNEVQRSTVNTQTAVKTDEVLYKAPIHSESNADPNSPNSRPDHG